jgi:hypothetical protein
MTTRIGSSARIVYARPWHDFRWPDSVRTIISGLSQLVVMPDTRARAPEAFEALAFYTVERQLRLLGDLNPPNSIRDMLQSHYAYINQRIDRSSSALIRSAYHASVLELEQLGRIVDQVHPNPIDQIYDLIAPFLPGWVAALIKPVDL